MKRAVIFTSLVLCSCASAVEYSSSPKLNLSDESPIAVFVSSEGIKENEKSVIDVAYDAAVSELIKTGVDVVEREKIDKILEEQEFSYSGFVDQKEAVKLGKLLGARSILFVYFLKLETEKDTSFGDSYKAMVGVKLIDVETGRILYTSRAANGALDLEFLVTEVVKDALKPLVRR